MDTQEDAGFRSLEFLKPKHGPDSHESYIVFYFISKMTQIQAKIPEKKLPADKKKSA